MMLAASGVSSGGCDTQSAPSFAAQFPRAARQGRPGRLANDSLTGPDAGVAVVAARPAFFLRSDFAFFGNVPGGSSMP